MALKEHNMALEKSASKAVKREGWFFVGCVSLLRGEGGFGLNRSALLLVALRAMLPQWVSK